MAITTLSSRQVLVSSIDIPDVKEVGGWLAGGMFRNESYPGGINYSPVGTPSFTNTMQSPGYAPNFLNGNFDYLNSGLSNMFSFINYGYYDLLVKSREKDVTVLEITVVIESIDSQSTSGDGDSEFVGEYTSTVYGNVVSTPDKDMSLEEIYAIEKGYSNIIGSITSGDTIKTVSSIYNVTTGQTLTMEQRVQSEVVGFVRSQLVNSVANQIASSIASTSNVAMLLSGVLGAVLNEFYEMSIGMDISFGYGGEYDLRASRLLGSPTYTGSEGFLGIGTIGQWFTDDTTQLTNILGDTVGYIADISDGIYAYSGIDGSYTIAESLIEEVEDFGMVDDVIANIDPDADVTVVTNVDQDGNLTVTAIDETDFFEEEDDEGLFSGGGSDETESSGWDDWGDDGSWF